jgi:hypothetical protein
LLGGTLATGGWTGGTVAADGSGDSGSLLGGTLEKGGRTGGSVATGGSGDSAGLLGLDGGKGRIGSGGSNFADSRSGSEGSPSELPGRRSGALGSLCGGSCEGRQTKSSF